MKTKSITALEIIELVPDNILDSLSVQSQVDFGVKKLHGAVMFKLVIYAFLNSKNISLRILEAIYNSEKFKSLFDIPVNTVTKKVSFAALSFRLQKIDWQYFEKIFQHLINNAKIQEVFFNSKRISLHKFDSTMLSISSKLLHWGTHTSGGKNNLKVTLELADGIPVNFILFKEQKYLNEDLALPELIKQKTLKKALNIAIFDRGIKKIGSYLDFNEQSISFISRLQNQSNFKVKQELALEANHTHTLDILHDQIINFATKFDTRIQKTEYTHNNFRLIITKSKITKQEIRFITNINFLTAVEITELYKSRWEIETFFKFIKQELNFKHLLSRDENGIKVMIFLTMITAILLTLYKKVNNVTGWVVTKIKFMDELESWLMHTWREEMAPAFVGLQSQNPSSASG